MLDIICVLIIPIYLYILWNVSKNSTVQLILKLLFREIRSSQRKRKAWQKNWKIMNAWATLSLEQKKVVSSKQSWVTFFMKSRLLKARNRHKWLDFFMENSCFNCVNSVLVHTVEVEIIMTNRTHCKAFVYSAIWYLFTIFWLPVEKN